MAISTKFFKILPFLFSAVAMQAQTAGDYRSTASGGNWSAVTSWEYYDGSTWAAANSTPTLADGVVSIIAGSTVTIEGDVSIDQVYVSGTLKIEGQTAVSIADHAGTFDLVILAGGKIMNFADKGTLAVTSRGLVFNTGSTMEIQSSGTYIHSTNTSASNTLSKCTQQSGSTWVYRNNPSFPITFQFSNRTYFNLVIENPDVTNEWSLSIAAASNSFLSVNGTLDIGGTLLGNIIFTDLNTSGSYNGNNMTMRAGNIFQTRYSNFNLSGNTSLVNGTTTKPTVLEVRASNLSNNGSVTSTGFFAFMKMTGTAAQAINGGGSMSLHNLHHDNSASVTVNHNCQVRSLAFLNQGGIVNSSNLKIGNGSSGANIQYGKEGGTLTVGTFDGAPTFNTGLTGKVSLLYMQEATARTTGVEIPGSRNLGFLLIKTANHVTLSGGSISVSDLELRTGTIAIGSNNITVTNGIEGGLDADNSYVLTNGTGSLVRTNVTGEKRFPVGSSLTSFDPATLDNSAGTADDFSVRVSQTVVSAPTELVRRQNIVNRQWDIQEAVAGGSDVEVTLQYDATATNLVGTAFVPGALVIGHHKGGW
jgi:hypothetical protein